MLAQNFIIEMVEHVTVVVTEKNRLQFNKQKQAYKLALRLIISCNVLNMARVNSKRKFNSSVLVILRLQSEILV